MACPKLHSQYNYRKAETIQSASDWPLGAADTASAFLCDQPLDKTAQRSCLAVNGVIIMQLYFPLGIRGVGSFPNGQFIGRTMSHVHSAYISALRSQRPHRCSN